MCVCVCVYVKVWFCVCVTYSVYPRLCSMWNYSNRFCMKGRVCVQSKVEREDCFGDTAEIVSHRTEETRWNIKSCSG